MKVLEDALVAELSPAECGGLVASRTGRLLQHLEGHALADADPTSACPFQVAIASTCVAPVLTGQVSHFCKDLCHCTGMSKPGDAVRSYACSSATFLALSEPALWDPLRILQGR